MKCEYRHVLGALVVTAALIGGPGCMSLCCRPIPIAPECTTACAEVPCACRGKVYVFLMSGFDPFDIDRVSDFRASLIRAGFTKVYNGQCYHDSYFASEMHRLALEEPDARFVVVGFSTGADYAASLAESVGHYGIPIALLATVDPYFWSPSPTKTPANVQQVMTVHGEPWLLANQTAAGTEVKIAESFPTSITAHPLTVETLARALTTIADALPHPPPPTAAPVVVDEQATPRPLTRTNGPRDSWDFLKPIASLRSLTPDEPTVGPVPSGVRTSLRPTQPPSAN